MHKDYVGNGLYIVRYKVSYKDGSVMVNYSECKANSGDDLSAEAKYYSNNFKKDSNVTNCDVTFKPYKIFED